MVGETQEGETAPAKLDTGDDPTIPPAACTALRFPIPVDGILFATAPRPCSDPPRPDPPRSRRRRAAARHRQRAGRAQGVAPPRRSRD